MADINHAHAQPTGPVEEDAVSFQGIFWFVVVLTGTTLFCAALVWGLFEFMTWRVARADAPRTPLAAAPAVPTIDAGRVATGTDNGPQPALLVREPLVLREFRDREQQLLTTYGLDPLTGAVRIPIERAKALALDRGFPARAGAVPLPVQAETAPTPAPPAPAAAPAHGAGAGH
jgi:hypothetical protein